jgi:hypothetical protein
MKSFLLYSCILLILRPVSASAQSPSTFSFSPLGLHEVATIALAVDVPNNLDPARVWFKKDPGHVFVILERIDTLAKRKQALVWGFYPTHPVSSIFFRRVKSELRNNAGREYNAVIRKQLSTEELQLVQEKSLQYAQSAYHLNRYNCYDYALNVFNSVASKSPLPVHKVTFPFAMGHGGSPCGLYQTLQALKSAESSWAPAIAFGCFQAPQNRPATTSDESAFFDHSTLQNQKQ